MGEVVQLKSVCSKGSSSLRQKDLLSEGKYPVYGAAGIAGYLDTYQYDHDYVAVIKDGAGVGRVLLCHAQSSVLGTLQAIVPNDSITLSYLRFLLDGMHLADFASGATIPHIYFKDYSKSFIDLPNINEQNSISQIFENLLRQIDLAKQMLAKADELIQSRFVEMFGDPVVNTKRWDLQEIKNLYTVTSAKRIYAQDLESEGIPFLKLGDLTNRIMSGSLSCSSFVNEKTFESLIANHQVPAAGDVLVTARGTMGLCYKIADDDRFYFQDGMITWLKQTRLSPNPVFFINLFSLPSFHERLIGGTSGTTISYLSIKALGQVSIIVPPLALQNEFAEFVSQVESLKTTTRQQLDRLTTLYDSLAQRYFAE